MIVQDVWNLELGLGRQKSICLQPTQELLSTDTGLLLFRKLDDQLDFITRSGQYGLEH